MNSSLVASTVSTFGSLSSPDSITVGNNGIIYITDPGNSRVATHNPQGDLYHLFPDEVEPVNLGVPGAIATDSKGAFYLTDTASNRVQLFHSGSADFGHVTLGSSGTPQTLTFDVDPGFITITGVAIYTAGTQNLDFTIAANSGTPCTTRLAENDWPIVYLRFVLRSRAPDDFREFCLAPGSMRPATRSFSPRSIPCYPRGADTRRLSSASPRGWG